MIKFFRKFRQGLLSQSKFSQYLLYAVGEIILVVIGILIALQLNEWNNERNRELAEQTIIIQLQADLYKSHDELKEIMDFYLERARICAQMTRAFYKEELPENIKNYMGGALASRVYSPVLGTARMLINSGKIDILSSTELKNDIIAYVEEVDYLLKDISRYEETYYRKGVDLVREVMPNSASIYSKKELDESNFGQMRRSEVNIHSYESPVEKVPFKRDLTDLFEDERFYRGYSYLLISHRNIHFRYDDILIITDELFERLNEEYPNPELYDSYDGFRLSFDTLDLRILQKADAILSDSTKWNKEDDRECDDEISSGNYSLFCALYQAQMELTDEYEHRRAAMELVRTTIEKYEKGRVVNHRLMDWNNHPDTSFEEMKKVLTESIEGVKNQLNEILKE